MNILRLVVQSMNSRATRMDIACMKQKVHIFSFFSGVGFLDLGFENNGFEVVFVNEAYGPFLKAYAYARKQLDIPEPRYGRHLAGAESFLECNNGKSLQSYVTQSRQENHLVGFIAGPPCPDFSVGGKNRGREGDKGKLSQSYIELICKVQPDFFLFENVKGLWRTKKHRLFYDELKEKLSDNGYFLTDRLINSIEYGVAQDRERIILLGFHEDILHDLSKPINELAKTLSVGSFPWTRYASYDREQILALEWPSTTPFIKDSETLPPATIPLSLTVEHWFRKNTVNSHPNSQHHFQPRKALPRFQTIDEGDVSKKSFKRLHRWRYSPTAAYGNNEVHIHPYKARRISGAEAMAIQSLPKAFALPPDISLTAMFKAIGNGVPYLAAYAIAQSIKDYLENNDAKTDNDRISSYDQRFVTQPFLPLREPAYNDTY